MVARNSSTSLYKSLSFMNASANDVFVSCEIVLRIFCTIERGVGMMCFGTESFAKPHLVWERPISRIM